MVVLHLTMPGSIILLGGDPGIGKSTLLLQFAHKNALKIKYEFTRISRKRITI